MEVDQVQEVMVGTCIMGFVKCEKKKWSSKEPLVSLAHFILTQVLWTNVRSVKCSSAWMPVVETSYKMKEC